MPRLHRTPTQRDAIVRNRMLPGAAAGRQAVVAPVSRPLRQATTATPVTETARWSHAGAVAVTASGDETTFDVELGGLIDELEADLKTAGSSSTVGTVYLNGVSIGTVTLAASDSTETDAITPVWTVPGDKLTGRVTTAGTGAKGFSMRATARR